MSSEKYHDTDDNCNWSFVKTKIVCKINLHLILTKPGCYHSDQVEVQLDSANRSLDKPRPGRQTQVIVDCGLCPTYYEKFCLGVLS